MAEYLIQDTTLTGIADKIRVLTGTEETLTPAEMGSTVDTFNTELGEIVTEQDTIISQLAAALEGKAGASGGATPSGTVAITENGIYDVMSYAMAEVNVPSGAQVAIGSLTTTASTNTIKLSPGFKVSSFMFVSFGTLSPGHYDSIYYGSYINGEGKIAIYFEMGKYVGTINLSSTENETVLNFVSGPAWTNPTIESGITLQYIAIS